MSALVGVRNAPAPALGAREHTRVLYEKYGQRVFTFCQSRLRNREEAQDATQTTFIYVLRALERGVVPEFELAWLLKIAFNVCRSTARASRRDLVADGTEIEQLPDLSDGNGADAERLEALRGALHALPESQRHGILLREWQGLSYAEIADEMNLSVGAVETLLFRARRNLARRLEHVRDAVGVFVFPIGTVVSAVRAALRGVLAKVAAIGAAGSVALVPIAAVDLLEARADAHVSRSLEPAVAVPARDTAPASMRSSTERPAIQRPSRTAAAPPQRLRRNAKSGRAVAGRYRVWPLADRAASAPPAAARATAPADAPAASTVAAAAPTPLPPASPPAALQPVTDPVSAVTGEVEAVVSTITTATGVSLP